VGRDRDDELIWCGDGELRRACCWATKASRRTAASVRDLGEPPNSEVNLLPPFAKEERRPGSRFSLRESRGGVGVVDANGLMLRTGMAAIAPGTRSLARGVYAGTEGVVCSSTVPRRSRYADAVLAVKNAEEETATG
jgi:hypothetical protein